MHWVNRGPEPSNLEEIRACYTPRWVQYYGNGVEPKPSDSRWRDFRNELKRPFFCLCAYCEELCPGEVDHFRPKSKFPDLVYTWSNWVLACHDCNQTKGAKWPSEGYVDPCDKSNRDRLECYFGIDTLTGEMIPKTGLSQGCRDKAKKTIDDLDLNRSHHLQKRLEWLLLISGALADDLDTETSDVKTYRDHLTSRSTQHSSVTRAWLSERGYQVGH